MDRAGNPVTFCYGCSAIPLEEQARKKGYILENAEIFDELSKSLCMLRLHGVITYKEWDRSLHRLHNLIGKNLAQIKEGTKW